MALEAMGRLEEAADHYRRFIDLSGTDEKFEKYKAEAARRIESIEERQRSK